MSEILIVDDDPSARELMATVLGYGGHLVREAADGAEALALAEVEQPALIIADLLMPTMDGFEFVRRLRSMPIFQRTPVIFYTASYLEREARNLARACGVEHILTKPAEPEQILEIVGRALGTEQAPVPAPASEEFHREHLSLLTAKLSQRAEHAVPRLNAMIELGLQLASERDRQRLLASFCTASRKIVGAKYAVVGLLDRTERKVRYPFASGLRPELAAAITSDETLYAVEPAIYFNRGPRRLRALAGDPRAVGLPAGHPPLQALLTAPIASPDRVYGWLCLGEKIGSAEFSEEDEALAQILASQVGRIYENGSLFDEIKHHADELEIEIAERIRAENALRESEARHRMLVEEARDVVFTLSPAQQIASLNPAFAAVTGWPCEEWIGRNFAEVLHPEDRAPALALFTRLMSGEKLPSFELRCRTKSGALTEQEFTVAPLLHEGRVAGVMGIARDVTERKQLEAQLRQAQKLESIGLLAGGVAHDFNNILTVIQGHSDLASARGDLPPAAAESLDEIMRAVERGAGLTRQLLAFSRQQVMQPRLLDVNTVVAPMTRMLERLLGANVRLQFQPAPTPALVRADAGMIEQVIVNLAVNARDAMPRGGPLTIRVSLETLDREQARHEIDASEGRFVRITVTDSGSGIAPEHRARIFEPFFTTKEVGKGTGLGLATVFGIVKQHRGWITVESEVGTGTSFVIHLPAQEAPAAGEPQPAPRTPAATAGTETILFVEDEEPLRRVIAKALEHYRYRVIIATTGAEAREIWARERTSIDLVVADIVTPGAVSGHELARQIHDERPQTPVILTSGYNRESGGGELIPRAGLHFLAKPFDLPTLMQAIRRALDNR